MKWFTSDWNLGEDRIGIDGNPNLFYRPFKSIEEQNKTIINNFINSGFQDGDELWHLGDVIYKTFDQEFLIDFQSSNYCLSTINKKFPTSKFNIIVGKYDVDKLKLLGKYFDLIWNDGGYIHITDDRYTDPYMKVILNHYPSTCKERMEKDALRMQDSSIAYGNKSVSFAITGHIHGLWKVQRNMINVGVDAWHFKPVAEDEIKFCWNAMQKFYDENVFPY